MNNTKTKPTDQKESTLNPEIRNKAEELFDLLEDEFDGTCGLAEDMAEEMGEMLRSHRGMEELRFAYLISRTKSQEAEYSFEEAIRYMTDETINDVHDLAKYSLEIIEVIEGDRPSRHLRCRVNDLKEIAPEMKRLAASEFEVRMKEYGNEINELKGDK